MTAAQVGTPRLCSFAAFVLPQLPNKQPLGWPILSGCQHSKKARQRGQECLIPGVLCCVVTARGTPRGQQSPSAAEGHSAHCQRPPDLLLPHSSLASMGSILHSTCMLCFLLVSVINSRCLMRGLWKPARGRSPCLQEPLIHLAGQLDPSSLGPVPSSPRLGTQVCLFTCAHVLTPSPPFPLCFPGVVGV